MKTFTLPGTDIVVPNVVLGLMRITDKSDDEVRTLVVRGPRRRHHDDRPRRHLRRRPARVRAPLRRGDATDPGRPGRGRHPDASPASCRPTGFDFSYEHIVESVEGRSTRSAPTTSTSCCCTARTRWSSPRRSRARSTRWRPPARCALRRLQPDARADRAAEAVRAAAARRQPAAAVHHARAAHRAGRRGEHAGRDQSISRDGGILDYCRLHDITIQAWSPFQAGFFTGSSSAPPNTPSSTP